MGRISQAQYDALLQSNRELAAQNARLVEENALLRARFEELASQHAAAQERIAELLAALGRKQRRDTPNPRPPQPPPSVDDEARQAFDERPRPPKPPRKKKKKRKQRTSAGRNPLPPHLPRDKHHVEPETCTECGSTDLVNVRERTEEKLTVVKAHMRVRRTVLTTCACNACGKTIVPRALPAPFERSKATCEWLAWLVEAKYGLLNPLDRIRRSLASKGIELATSYLVSQIERAADILSIIDGEHWKQLRAGDWMAMDATGLKVCIKGVKGTHNGNLEAFHNGETVVFQYEPTREGGPLVSKLASFSGVLVADAEHRHNGVFKDGSVIEAGCNAHGRRKLREAEKTQPVLAKEAGDFISAMYRAEAKAHEQGLDGETLTAWRREHCAPHLADFEKWIAAVKPTLLPSDPLAKALAYYERHWDALTRFVEYPQIPVDNSATERLYQHVAKLRHNCLFAGSTEGAHRTAVLLGIIATCRMQGLDAEAYLSWAFTRRGTHRDLYNLSAAELTPAAYARWLERPGGT